MFSCCRHALIWDCTGVEIECWNFGHCLILVGPERFYCSPGYIHVAILYQELWLVYIPVTSNLCIDIELQDKWLWELCVSGILVGLNILNDIAPFNALQSN